jgi:flagellar hook-associated protein 1 FlgK
VDFFESPIGTAPGVTPTVTAHDIKLSTLVASDPSYVSAGRAGWNGVSEVPAPGDNSIALAIAALQTSTTMVDATNGQLTDPPPTTSLPGLSGASISGYWTTSVGAVGLSSSRAKSDVTVATALKSQADTRRQSTSGVAIDEELINLMRTQQAYAAASKVVAAVDEMTKTLIGMV